MIRVTLENLPLFATDAELGPAILGKRASEWPRIAKLYEGHGLPKINPLLGGRYTPAVRRFFDCLEGTATPGNILPARDGPEKDGALWNETRKQRMQRERAEREGNPNASSSRKSTEQT